MCCNVIVDYCCLLIFVKYVHCSSNLIMYDDIIVNDVVCLGMLVEGIDIMCCVHVISLGSGFFVSLL